MNQFQYEIKIQEIEEAKTQVALEKIFRELYEQFDKLFYWSIDKNHIEETILLYKALELSTSKYTGSKGVPEFIQRPVDRARSSIATFFIDSDETYKVSYEEFLDTFKYVDGPITFSSSNSIDELVKLADIYGTNPITKPIQYNFSVDSFFRNLVDRQNTHISLGESGSLSLAGLIEIEEAYKKFTYKSTIMEDIIEKSYQSLANSPGTIRPETILEKNTDKLASVRETLISMAKKV